MLNTPEQYLADAFFQDRLRDAQHSELVKLALDSTPHRPSGIQVLFSRAMGMLRKHDGMVIRQTSPIRKAA